MLLLLCFGLTPAQSQDEQPLKYEFRAVWLTTAAGLDWPTTTDPLQQQQSLRSIVKTIHDEHFNAIFFQVRPRGDAYYASTHEPWAENLTGVMGRNPGWDPLAYLIDQAHAAGIEVHAWFNVFKIHSNNSVPVSEDHPLRKFPQWSFRYQGEDWMDPGYPGVRNYTAGVILDLVRKYDIDGINLDYMRYPGSDVPDDRSYAQYGRSTPRDEWRAKNVDDFVSAVYDSVMACKPWVKVGSSPVGAIGTSLDRSSSGTLRKYAQDAPLWLRNGKQDYIAPQLYWTINGTKTTSGFSSLLERWRRWAGDRHVYAGIAAYKPEVMKQVQDQIAAARAFGAEGEAFFRYQNVREYCLTHTLYRYPALVPPMPWKASKINPPPGVLAVSETRPGVFELEWNTAAEARTYVVYRSAAHAPSLDDPRNILAVLPSSTTAWVDSISSPRAATYFYAVTSRDGGNNESGNAALAEGTIREAKALANAFPKKFDLQISRADTTSARVLVVYRNPEPGPVKVEVVSRTEKLQNVKAETVLEGAQPAGVHFIEVDASRGSSGAVRLTSRSLTLERAIP
ncbi:MAG: family 10 glycosylhydrolase [Bacteroidota bacterium]